MKDNRADCDKTLPVKTPTTQSSTVITIPTTQTLPVTNPTIQTAINKPTKSKDLSTPSEVLTTSSSSSSGVSVCPTNHVEVGERCYKFVNTVNATSFTNAGTECEKTGRLAAPRD